VTVYRREAENADQIAKLLRTRGRMIITAPPKSGKTTELLRYAESRYPNGRFAVVCARKEDRSRIIQTHWNVYNGISFVDVVTKRLLGEELDGDDVNEPTILVPPNLYFPNDFIPVFADDWELLPKAAQKAILRRRLFIAAVTSRTEEEGNAEESQDG
jgi:hypothetical protein